MKLLTRDQILMLGQGHYEDARQLGDGSWVAFGKNNYTAEKGTILFVDIDRLGARARYLYDNDDAAMEQYHSMLTRNTIPSGFLRRL